MCYKKIGLDQFWSESLPNYVAKYGVGYLRNESMQAAFISQKCHIKKLKLPHS